MLRERVCTAGGWGHWSPGSMDAAASEAEGQVWAAGRSGQIQIGRNVCILGAWSKTCNLLVLVPELEDLGFHYV